MLIAIDWGTTSFRAYLFDNNDNVVDNIAATAGIMQVDGASFEDVLYSKIADWLEQYPQAVILASGMITSKQGWIETPYLPCPASLNDLSKNLTEHVTGRGNTIYFVPGVCQEAPVPNIMRGEETQMAGLQSEESLLAILPGTHSKWIRMRGNTIEQFSTFMTGEVFAALTQHTILGRLLTEGEDPVAFAQGVKEGFSSEDGAGGILSKLFGARAMPLMGLMDTGSIRDYLSGLLLGSEVHEAMRSGFSIDSTPVLCGNDVLVKRYQECLKLCGLKTDVADSDLAATGLLRIAKAAALADG